MKPKWFSQPIAGLALTALMLPPAFAAGAEQPFTLARAVPADAFLCISARHNPERAFVDAYWGEIFDAAKASGIGADFMDLLGGIIGSEGMDEVNRLKDRATTLLEGVDWSAMSKGEFVFAERMNAAMQTGGNISMGPPDFLVLVRGENTAQNYTGLVALLDGALDEIKKAAGSDAEHFTIAREERAGAQVATIVLATREQNNLAFAISVAQHDDVIVIAAGDRILDDALALLAGDKANPSLADGDRYKAAFAQLPAAEDSAVFFDVQALLKPIAGLLGMVSGEMHGVDDVVLNAKDSGEAFDLNAEALTAYRAGEKARALELVTKAAEADPSDSRVLYNLACFNAINGNNDAALAALTKAVDAGFYSPGLIATDGDLEPLRENDAFKQALAKATESAAKSGGDKAAVVKNVVNRLLGVPGMFDYVASIEYTDGYSLHNQTVVSLVPGAENNPFYPVITRKPDDAAFDRYLPEETKSFHVSGGFDLNALYTFIKDTFKAAGSDGQSAWAEWENWQEEVNFDVHKNVLDWIGGDLVTVDLADNKGTVLMLKVTDDAVAREKVGAAVEFLSTKLVEEAATNPMLGMMSVRKSPVQHEKLQGFENLFIGMSPQPVVWGVADGHLIFADKADAIVTCLDTAAGSHPGVRKNARVMEEALVPEGAFVSVSLTDQRALGQEIAQGLGILSMVSGMATMAVPDPEARKVIGKISGMVMKLTPVVSKIDFYKSIASQTTFNGKAWRVHAVTHYAAPEERTASAQAVP